MQISEIEILLEKVNEAIIAKREMESIKAIISSIVRSSEITNKSLFEKLRISRSTFQQKLSGERKWKDAEVLIILEEIKKALN